MVRLSLILHALGLFSWVAYSDCNQRLSRLSSKQISKVHQDITTELSEGEVVEARSGRMSGNTHDLWFAKIYHAPTHRTRDVVLKPREWGDNDGWGRAPMEYVAYRLNRLLGMDYVPPTVYRHELKVKTVTLAETPVIFYVPDASILSSTDRKDWGLSEAAVLSDNRILNVLLHNQDGHEKNLLLGTHWTGSRKAPVFIDFGASLRPGTHVTMRKYPAKGNSDPVSQVRSATLAALKELKREDFISFQKYLSEEEIVGILSRRDGIVSYFERLINEKGFSEVVLTE